MHELSVTEGILRICLEEGEKHKIQKIKKINLVVGELTGLIPSCITDYFKLVSKGTMAESAEIMINKFNIEVKCLACGYQGELDKEKYLCPKCKSENYKIVKGKEFYIDTMEVE